MTMLSVVPVNCCPQRATYWLLANVHPTKLRMKIFLGLGFWALTLFGKAKE